MTVTAIFPIAFLYKYCFRGLACVYVIIMRLFCSTFAIIVIKLYIFNTNLYKSVFIPTINYFDSCGRLKTRYRVYVALVDNKRCLITIFFPRKTLLNFGSYFKIYLNDLQRYLQKQAFVQQQAFIIKIFFSVSLFKYSIQSVQLPFSCIFSLLAH